MTEFTGEIHPFAARFPMLSADDMDALVESIAHVGQTDPILLDTDGRLRNQRTDARPDQVGDASRSGRIRERTSERIMTPEAQEWADKLLSEYQANLDAVLDDFDAKTRAALGLSEADAA